jgi:hypothetical protein
MVARVGKHDATRPVAELQSSSRRRNDRCAVDDEAETIRAEALTPRPAMLPGPACAGVLGTRRVKGSLRLACGRP